MTVIKKTPYFAYGSNMYTEQMTERCPGHSFEGKAVLAGKRFIINSNGVATIAPEKSSHVWGIVWMITDADERELDRREGVRMDIYRRAFVQVSLEGGEPVTALTYIATDTTTGPPRAGYMERIVEGAQSHVLPEEYSNELKSWLRPAGSEVEWQISV